MMIFYVVIFLSGWLWFCQENRSRSKDVDVLWYTRICSTWNYFK